MWVWWLLVALLAFCFTVLKVQNKFKKKDTKSYWAARGVYDFKESEVASFYERWTYRIPFHFFVQRMYNVFKKRGLRYGGIMEGKPTLVLLDLGIIKHVMVKDFDIFVNRTEAQFGKAEEVLQKMLIRLKDQEWKDLRTTISPTFSSGKIRRMYQIFSTSASKMVDYVNEKVLLSSSGKAEVEIRDFMTRYTLDVISSAAFGLDAQAFSKDGSQFMGMANRMQTYTLWSGLMSLARLVVPNLFILLRIPIRDGEMLEYFTGVIRKTIKHRQETGQVRDDFLQLLIEAQKQVLEDEETEQVLKGAKKIKLTEAHVLAQCMIFLFSGVDAVETMLIFTCYSLALNPDVQENLYREVRESYDRNGSTFTYESIMEMEYLDKVLSEVMRMYPQGFRTPRVASQDFKVPNSDLVLEKGTPILVPVYAIHYDEDYYPNPLKFDPERFSAENKGKRNTYAYMPFGVGPRNCIATRFALFKGKVAIANLVLNFELEPSQKTAIPMKYSTMKAMRPNGGVIYLAVKARSQVQ